MFFMILYIMSGAVILNYKVVTPEPDFHTDDVKGSYYNLERRATTAMF